MKKLTAISMLVTIFTLTLAIAQQTKLGPITSPNINADFYVGTAQYPTIQSAVTAGCAGGSGKGRVVITPRATPSDTIAAASGCAGVAIIDERTATFASYGWNGTAYVIASPAGSSTAQGASGSTQVTDGNGNLNASNNSTVLNALPIQEFTNTAHPPLAYWDAALHNCRNQVVSVNIYADSRSLQAASDPAFGGQGPYTTVPATWAGRWVSRLTTQLQRMCGSHGSGIQPLRWGTGTFTAQGFNEFMYSYTSGVGGFMPSDTALGPYQGSDSMVVKTTVDNNVIGYWPQNPDGSGNFQGAAGGNPYPVSTLAYDHLRVYCVSGPGLHGWTVAVDGNYVGTCGGTAGSETATLFVSPSLALSTHQATVTCTTHPCSIYAMEATSGTTGVSVNNLSIGSSSLEAFVSSPTQYAFENIDPDVAQLHIVNHVTNEINQGISLSTFQASLAAAVSHAATRTPNPASILFVANMIDSITNGQLSQALPYYAAIRTAAQNNNAAFVDLRDRWGQGMAPAFLFGDTAIAHESNAGNGEIWSAVSATVIDAPFTPAVAVSCSTGSFVSAIDAFGTASCTPPPTCGNGYAHGATLNLAAATGGTPLPNYVALLGFNGATSNSITLANLATVANSGQVQITAGTDITFCTAASRGYVLPFERVSYTATGGAEFYVSVPSLASTGTTPVYMFWGNASAADDSNPTLPWTLANYVSVNHFGTPTTLGLTDSSGSGNNLTNYAGSAAATTGLFGGAANLGASSYLSAAGNSLPSGSSARTIEGWVKFTTAPTVTSMLFGYGNPGAPQGAYFLDNYPPSNNTGIFVNGDPFDFSYTSDTAWHQWTFENDAGASIAGVRGFKDGSQMTGTCLAGTCTAVLATQGTGIQINGYNGLSNLYPEYVDEFRISSVARSTGWISTEYANMNNPSTFVAIGSTH